MAGNSQSPNSTNNEGPKSDGPRVKTFACTRCGASVTIRNPGKSMSVVCESCHAIIDITDENYKILSHYYDAQAKFSPLLPLGVRGQISGQTWEVIGFLVRTDKASNFSWEEYLLFNPYHGYRWLTQNNGHWNFVTPIKEKPSTSWEYIKTVELDGKKYRLFYQGAVFITYVLGEFYWKVAVASNVFMADYICPPEMLSSEKDKDEISWSLSQYIEPDIIKSAFKLETPLPERIGVASNQPSKWSNSFGKIIKLWIIFLVVLTFMEIAHLCTASNKTAFENAYPYTANTKSTNTLTTSVFTIDKDKANLAVIFTADVDNSWFYVSGELVNNKTGETYPFERTVEYYHGYEGGEHWSEGSQSSQLLLSSIPGGEYYLNLDADSGGFTYTSQHQFILTVRRDVSTYSNYFWCALFLSIMPAIVWWRHRTFEITRWSDSDMSPYQSSD